MIIYVYLYCIVRGNWKFDFILKHIHYEQRYTTSQSKRCRETDKICLDRSLVRYVIRKKKAVQDIESSGCWLVSPHSIRY